MSTNNERINMLSFSVMLILIIASTLLIFVGLHFEVNKSKYKHGRTFAVLAVTSAITLGVSVTLNTGHIKTSQGMYEDIVSKANRSDSTELKAQIHNKTQKG